MVVLISILSIIAVVVNAVGAWGVSRRRLLIGLFFLAASTVLVIATVSYWFGYTGAWTLLFGGAVLSVAASILNAAIVIGDFVLWRHIVRAAAYAALVYLGLFV